MPMKICERCRAELEDNAKFCTDCGAKQEPKKCFCSRCGTELNQNAKFCSECGTPTVSAQAVRSEDKNLDSAIELSGKAQEIKEQGGIIVYNDLDEHEVKAAKKLLADLDPDMGYYLSDDFDLHKLIDRCVKSANLKFKKFGEPGRDIQEYGYPDDDYRGKIEYAILDDEKLILRGEGNTFRVLSDKAQKESEENFWVLNKAIQKLKDQIDTILVEGEDMSLRARLFKDFSHLDTVILGKGVDGIRVEAFAGCPIKNIVLPSTMWHLVESAFVGAEFKSFFIPPLSPEEQYFSQFQSDSIVDCKNLKYVFFPQRLFDARTVSNFFKGCDNLDPDNVWEVKDLMSENNNLITNKKEKPMDENSKLWVRLYPEGESVKVYKVGTSFVEEADTLEDPRWELYFANPGYEIRYELSEDDSYLDGAVEDGYFEFDSCIRISKIISALNTPDSEIKEDKEREIKEILQHPRFDKGVSEAYKHFIKCLSHPGISEEDAVLMLFKNVIKDCNISNPVGIEVDGTEEEAFKVGYFINTSVSQFDPNKLFFLSFDCWFEGLSSAFGYMEGVTQCILNLVIYDGIIYSNSDVDDGFYDGCENSDVFLVNGENMQEDLTD